MGSPHLISLRVSRPQTISRESARDQCQSDAPNATNGIYTIVHNKRHDSTDERHLMWITFCAHAAGLAAAAGASSMRARLL